MPISARGSRFPIRRLAARRLAAGFTLIELLVVVAIVGFATGLVTLAIRDPQSSRLDQEAMRLAALLESARAESRAAGIAVVWVPTRPGGESASGTSATDFRFAGLPARVPMPTRWLDRETQAELIGTRAVVLGPEPVIGPQRILLRLGDHRLEVATDGLGPFAVNEAAVVKPER